MTAERRSSDNHATPEQLDYLAWYLGGDSEYPTYSEDKYGRVMAPGYRNEVSLDALIADENDAIDGRPVVRGETSSPEDAIARFFGSSHLATLSKRERQVFILRHVCGMWPREIADYLGIGAQTAKNVLQRANAKLGE